MTNVKPVPDGYHTITPYLFIRGAAHAIDFYKSVFNATELFRMPGPIGQVMHAELKIGDSIIMMADENPKMGAMSPKQPAASPPACTCTLKMSTASSRKQLTPARNYFAP